MSKSRIPSSIPSGFDVRGFPRTSEAARSALATAVDVATTPSPAGNLEGARLERETKRRFQPVGFRRVPRRCRYLRETASNRSFGRRPVGVTRTLSVARRGEEDRTLRNRGDSPGSRTVPSACIRIPRGPSRPPRGRRRRRRRSTFHLSEVGASPVATARSSTSSTPARFLNYRSSEECRRPDDAFVPRRSSGPSRESRDPPLGGTRSRSHRRSCAPLAYRVRPLQPSRKLVGRPISFGAVSCETPPGTSTRVLPTPYPAARGRREGPGSTPGRRHSYRGNVSRNKDFRRFP